MPEVHFKQQLAKLHKIDPEKAWAELQRVCKDNNGIASPQAIVDRARPSRNPLHKAFEWDDTKAAEEYRKEQARSLVHNFEIVFEDGSNAPAMVNVKVGRQRGYVNTEQAIADDDLRKQVIVQAVRQLLGLEKRYRSLNELAKVFQETHLVALSQGVDVDAA
jgi:hypothetical protein